jgi:hypothetical protein
MNPIDTKVLREKWPPMHEGTTHSGECYKWHYSCAIHRLCDELDEERKRAGIYYNIARDSMITPYSGEDEYWER